MSNIECKKLESSSCQKAYLFTRKSTMAPSLLVKIGFGAEFTPTRWFGPLGEKYQFCPMPGEWKEILTFLQNDGVALSTISSDIEKADPRTRQSLMRALFIFFEKANT